MEQHEPHDGQRNSADVIIIDGLPPEEGAMSQSLYSRKPKSILFLLLQVLKKGAEGFMKMFYSGYGHNSIGDCGSITLYFENVSMLAAKAIQAWALYNGQEASTRYLDFSGRMMINPLGGWAGTTYLYIPKEKLNAEDVETIDTSFKEMYPDATDGSIQTPAGAMGRKIQEKWMDFYQRFMPIVKAYVASLNPKSDHEDQAQYDKAINARAFDIMRAFIPAGMTTLVSWHSNIRQIRDHLAILKYHPSNEVARISQTALEGLGDTYPSSFPKKEYSATEDYFMLRSRKTSYFKPRPTTFNIDARRFHASILKENYEELLNNRPPKTELPPEVGEAGTVHVMFNIDFGSFRDAQRHRKGAAKMPLLTTEIGFHPWYLERLPEEGRKEAEALIAELVPMIKALPCSEVDQQYYIPMGFMVVADFTWTFDQCVYVAELRSSETVHPTFRVHAQALGEWIKKVFPKAALHVDWTGDKWSYKRGSQDIHEKV